MRVLDLVVVRLGNAVFYINVKGTGVQRSSFTKRFHLIELNVEVAW
jgi:hypothetical protein